MSPDEAKLLHGIGKDVVVGFVAMTNKTIWFTIYTYFVFKASMILLHRRRRRARGPFFTMLAIAAMYLIVCVLWSLDFAALIIEAKYTLIDQSDDPLSVKLDRSASVMFKFADVTVALYAYLSLLGDAIIIWRVYVLMPSGRKWIAAIPLAVLVGSLISVLMLTYCVTQLGSAMIFMGSFEKPAFCRDVQTVTFSMAFSTTTIATSLIAMATWHYRKDIKPSLSKFDLEVTKRRRSQVERVMVLLLESGLLYFLFFAVQLITNVPQVRGWIAARPRVAFTMVMYSYCASVLVGLYPTVVVVLANSELAVIDVAASGGTSSTFQTASSGGTIAVSGSRDIDSQQERQYKDRKYRDPEQGPEGLVYRSGLLHSAKDEEIELHSVISETCSRANTTTDKATLQ